MSHKSNRRSFLKRGLGAGLFAAGWARAGSGNAPNGKIQHAGIGVGGKGWSDVLEFASHPDVTIAASHCNSSANRGPTAAISSSM